jgi:hypothetical protein
MNDSTNRTAIGIWARNGSRNVHPLTNVLELGLGVNRDHPSVKLKHLWTILPKAKFIQPTHCHLCFFFLHTQISGMEHDTPQLHHTALQDPPLESALDALLSDYLDRLDILFRAYSPERPSANAGSSNIACASSSISTSSEAQCLKLHEEAVERRNLVGLFESGLHVGSSTGTRNEQGAEQKERRELVSLPSILELNQEDQEIWKRWRPEVDETVLVYLSPVRGYWPGKVS